MFARAQPRKLRLAPHLAGWPRNALGLRASSTGAATGAPTAPITGGRSKGQDSGAGGRPGKHGRSLHYEKRPSSAAGGSGYKRSRQAIIGEDVGAGQACGQLGDNKDYEVNTLYICD